MTELVRQSLTAYGAPLCETIADCPQPRGSEVLVRVERCGVCHSDLHIQDGYFRLGGDKKLDITQGRALPFTLGHKTPGTVAAPRPLGVYADGGYASHVLVPHPRYLIDYAPLSPALAGAAMCSGLTAYAALRRLAEHAGRGPVLLIGLGGVGSVGRGRARAP